MSMEPAADAIGYVEATTLKKKLASVHELALVDLREQGQ